MSSSSETAGPIEELEKGAKRSLFAPLWLRLVLYEAQTQVSVDRNPADGSRRIVQVPSATSRQKICALAIGVAWSAQLYSRARRILFEGSVG